MVPDRQGGLVPWASPRRRHAHVGCRRHL